MSHTAIVAATQAEIIEQIKSLVIDLETVEQIEAARIACSAPFNEKRTRLRKEEMEAKRRVREEAAEKLCRSLQPGEKVVMSEHGFLDIFNARLGAGDVFFDANATVHVYQPRKRILWLNVTGTKGHNEKFAKCRPFTLHDVASNNVRRPA